MAESTDAVKWLLDFGFDRWHSRTGIAAVLFAVLVVSVGLFAGLDIGNVSWPEWGIVTALFLGTWIAWWRTRIPRVPVNSVGFGVAVELEDPAQAPQFRSDFVLRIRDLLNVSRFRYPFKFVEFPQSVAKRITDDDQARWLMQKGNIHFLIRGRARHRTPANGSASYVLDLFWYVRHRPITPEQSQALANDGVALFPSRWILNNAGDVAVADVAAQHADAVARYIIGTAAAVSNDFAYAEELLLDAEMKLAPPVQTANGTSSTPVAVARNRVRQRVADVYKAQMRGYSAQFSQTRDLTYLEEGERVAFKLRSYEPNDYGAHLTRAMSAFLLRRDVTAAMQEIESCRQYEDGARLYSKAFLIAYEGDLEGAYRTYRAAFAATLQDDSVPNQCEVFIQSVLDAEPERPWLYYCLGLINFKAKGDLAAARADFQRFVDQGNPLRFGRHIAIARTWIAEMDGAEPV